jgi:hypothetical protein
VVAGVIALSSLQILNHTSNSNNKQIITASKNIPAYVQESKNYKTPQELNEGIASLSDDEIVNYLQSTGNILDEDVITKNVDTKQLPSADDYLVDENALNKFIKNLNAGSSKNIQ